jgi:hypothetical protein
MPLGFGQTATALPTEAAEGHDIAAEYEKHLQQGE